MIDQPVGAKLGRRSVGETETHRDDRHGGGARRADIGDRIANKDTVAAVAVDRGDGSEDMAGVGLGPRHRIEPEIGAKARLPTERRDQRPRQRHRLVGADRQPAAGGGKAVERGLDSRPGPRAIGDMIGVEGEERRHPGLDEFGGRHPARRQPAFEQLARAMADHVADLGRRHRRAAKPPERMVQRRGQVGGGINEGAVEIEHHGSRQAARIARGHAAFLRRRRFPRQGRYGRAGGVTDRHSRPLAAVILAAGQGTRMRSGLHKVLHPIAAKPMLLHLLDSLVTVGPQQTIVVVGAGREQVEAAVAGREVAIAVQAEQLGTGHAVLQAKDSLATFDGDVIILYGDVPLVGAETMARMLAALTGDVAAVVLGFRPADAGAYGRIIATDGNIEKMVEFKDASAAERAVRLCNSGLMAVRAADLWAYLARVGNANAAGEYYLVDLPNLAIADGRRVTVIETAADEVAGVNSRAELAALEARWQDARRARAMADGVTLIDPGSVFFAHDTEIARDVTIEPFVVFGPGVTIASGTTIHSHSHVAGAAIGENCVVGPFARLRPGSRLAADVKIGNFVETKNADFAAGAKASHLSYLGDASIGAEANIGAGTITCNYDGFFKYRTVIGAGAFIGSNSALVAPVTIGAGGIVGAGSTITADVAPDALALVRPATIEKPGWATRFRSVMSSKRAGNPKAS